MQDLSNDDVRSSDVRDGGPVRRPTTGTAAGRSVATAGRRHGGAEGGRHRRRMWVVWGVALLWMVLMAPLAMWGLPDRSRDEFLFGGEEAWPAERFGAGRALQELCERAGGADTDRDPIADTTRIVDLTADEASRAAILLRYRLYSRQPDEMITFRALQRMKPREFDFDPKLYQYCGGYIYLIGAALGAAHALGLAHITSDLNYYLDDPAAFGRFYVVARGVSLLFGALALVAAYRLARRGAGRVAGGAAMVCLALSPVFITGVLEAKPHVPAACMILWAINAALDWHAGERWRDAVRMGIFAGAAFGLVLTGLFSAAIAAALLVAGRPSSARLRQVAAGVGIAAGMYLALNPYVAINAIRRPETLRSNIGNSTAMYSFAAGAEPWAKGAKRVAWLTYDSCGAGILAIGALGGLAALRRYPRETVIAGSVGVVTIGVCAAIGAGKPAEFARFLLLPVMLLCAACGYAIGRLASRWAGLGVVALGAVFYFSPAPAYFHAFATDARAPVAAARGNATGSGGVRDARDAGESRLEAARFLRGELGPEEDIGLLQEPAPYAVPPLDFAHRRVRLLPKERPAAFEEADLPRRLVFTADDLSGYYDAWWKHYYDPTGGFPDLGPAGQSKIAWANKTVFTFRRRLP